ncbi:MAG: CubicO group peptidase (beta-lactamase class C family) [Flavobacteriales bacterium]|jgi:CubicO group peptidase (beta-lactamase class C family)
MIKPHNKLIIVLLILFVSCKSPSNKKVETKSIELEQLEASIDSLFNSKISKNNPGATILVSFDGKILIGKGYGLRDIESKAPISPTTNLRMASLSKQFTALCVLSLLDKELLSLNDEVYTYLPYPIFKNMTIENLLNHTSGLPEYEDYFENNWNKNKIVENKNVLDWLATNPKVEFKPSEKWQYSNTAYLMLPLIVEKVSGIEFSLYAKEHVFKKAGMLNSNYYNLADPVEIPERAYCYVKDSLNQFKKADGFYMNGVMGDGAVYTSINDYFKYDLALRNKTIVSKKSHELIFKPSSTHISKKGTKYQYGMGWFLTDTTAYHSGGWIGTNTRVMRSLDKPLTIAVFSNFEGDLSTKELVNETYILFERYSKNYR